MNVNIGMQVPDFTAITTFGPLKLSDFKGQWVVLYFSPRRFHIAYSWKIYLEMRMT